MATGGEGAAPRTAWLAEVAKDGARWRKVATKSHQEVARLGPYVGREGLGPFTSQGGGPSGR